MTKVLVADRKKESSTPTLRTAADGRLAVVVDSVPIPVRLRQCFPWSEPGLWLPEMCPTRKLSSVFRRAIFA